MRKHSKAENQKYHAEKRFKERTSLPYHRQTLLELRGLIRKGKSVLVEKQSHRVSLHQVEYLGEKLIVTYDKVRKQVVTVWPVEVEDGI